MKAMSTIIKILASLGGLFILLGGTLMAITYPYGEPFESIVSDEYKIVIDKSENFDSDNIKKISVNGNMNLTIENNTSKKDISVRGSGTIVNRRAKADDLVMKVIDGGILKISLKPRFNYIGFISINRMTVALSIPASYSGKLEIDNTSKDVNVAVSNTFSEVEIDSASGHVKLSKLTTNKLDADIHSGELILADIKANYLDLNLTSGYVSLKNLETHNTKIVATSGDINGSNLSATNNINLNATSGDIKITGISADSIETQMTSGKIALENIETKKISSSQTSGKLELSLKTVAHVTVKLTSGDAVINAPAPTNYNCTIKVASGKVVNNSYFSKQPEKFTSDSSFKDGEQARATSYNLNLTSGKITLNKI